MTKTTDSSLGAKTIRDFGDQWTAYPENEGAYASLDTLKDLVAPFDIRNFENSVVADIGSGSGRIVNMLLAAGARHIYAVEPSKSFEVLKKNTERERERERERLRISIFQVMNLRSTTWTMWSL